MNEIPARPRRPRPLSTAAPAGRPVPGGPLAASWLALCVAASLAACGGSPSPAAPAPTDAGPTADLVTWAPDAAGTTAVPVYGRCRLGAERVLWAASNGALDDRVSLTAAGGEAELTIRVLGAAGVVLEGDVRLARALADKSYREATGTARWAPEGLDAEVVDGTLCFSQRLADGAPVDAEFSLVLAVGDGTYASVSGDFHLPGGAVSTSSGVAVQGDALDVDLR